MNKTILVSNRLPLEFKISAGQLQTRPSVGGLATGLKSVHHSRNSIWVGWSGLTEEQLDNNLSTEIQKKAFNERCVTVPLSESNVNDFYLGFSNKALWPLFHYFTEYVDYELKQWEAYIEVNSKFADKVLEFASDGDNVWIHDYQLMLLPMMLRERNPTLTIGFFLHIPFPAFEIFRTFPWREELLKGMLGASLIGFHTYDYVQHFLNSVKRIIGHEVSFNEVHAFNRIIKTDSFPMGIDYNQFHSAALRYQNRYKKNPSELIRRINEHRLHHSGTKLILSIDRMDYSKGIPNRIKAFEHFLEQYPEFIENVRLIMLVVPSRSNVPQYKRLKKETDELVGRLNGRFATINWTPIWYFYRAMPFEDLIGLYASSDVALVSPLRDGMNLVAKEYVATRVNHDGVLILSEMAGAAAEMQEALFINPNNIEQFTAVLKQALEMPVEEQAARIKILQERLARYNVDRWAGDFIRALETTTHPHERPTQCKKVTESVIQQMRTNFIVAKKRLVLLDYDGTLVGFKNDPALANPDEALYVLLDKMAAIEDTEIVIISGRDRTRLEKWFAHKDYSIITDHGVWLKRTASEWEELELLRTDWKEHIRPVVENFVDRTPGTFIEEKNYSLAWHYRKADEDMAVIRTRELKFVLTGLVANNGLSVLEGDKVLEIKSSSVSKGKAAAKLLARENFDFVMAIGDDWTDEHMFEELPNESYTIKVGNKKTIARYFIDDSTAVRNLLSQLNLS